MRRPSVTLKEVEGRDKGEEKRKERSQARYLGAAGYYLGPVVNRQAEEG